MADTLVIEVATEEVVEIATVGPQGPQGPPGSGGSGGDFGDLDDVTFTSLASGDVPRYNGTAWVNVAQSALAVAWASLTGVPTEFPPSSHTHVVANITDFVTSVNTLISLAAVDWSQLTSVPSTFPPSAHTHVAANITDFATAADARIAAASIDALADVTITTPASNNVLKWNGSAWVNGFVAWTELTGVPPTFPPSAHTHVAANITDFSTAADARIAAASIDALADVTISTPTTAQVLRYNGSAWVNAQLTYADLGGTVPALTSVALAVPSFLSVSGSPLTSNGTITVSLANQTTNLVFAAPNGSTGAPTFRSLASADVPFAVVGPGSATDNAVCRFDTTTGKLIQNSAVTIADTTGDIVTPGFLHAGSATAYAEVVGGLLSNTYAAIKAGGSATDVGLILQAKGAGAITVQQPDNGIAGGNARGTSAIDLQLGRAAATSVASGAFSALLGGNDNSAQQGADVCVGGSSNTCSAGFGVVLGGSVAESLAPYAVCIGGDSPRASSDYAIAVGGQSILSAGYNSVNIGGSASEANGDNSVVIGGDESYASGQSVIIGARLSSTSADQGVIIGGKSCTNDGEQCAILGGLSNSVSTGIAQCVVLAGTMNTAGALNSVVMGNSAITRDEGTFAMGAGTRAGTPGTHQSVFATMSVDTTNATPADATLNNAGANLTIPSGKSVVFQITGVARNTSNGDTKMFCLRQACLKNVTGTTSLVGSVQTSGTDQSDAGMSTASIAITADNTNDKLKIAVTGIAATNISWTFTIIATEVA